MEFMFGAFLIPLVIAGVIGLCLGLLLFAWKLILIPLKLAMGLVGILVGIVVCAVVLPLVLPIIIAVMGIGLAIFCVVLVLVLLPLGLLFWWV